MCGVERSTAPDQAYLAIDDLESGKSVRTVEKTGYFMATGTDGQRYLIFEYTRMSLTIDPATAESQTSERKVYRLIDGTRVFETTPGVFSIGRAGDKLLRSPPSGQVSLQALLLPNP